MNPLPRLLDRPSRQKGVFRRRSPRRNRWFWIWVVALTVAALVIDLGLFSSSTVIADTNPAETEETSDRDGDDSDEKKPSEHGHEGEGGGHDSPVAPLLAGIVLILLLAKFGGDLFERVGMPAVLGELTVGVLLGTIRLTKYVDWDLFQFLNEDHPANEELIILAEIGVILLLFEVGLESRVHEMLSVGVSSMLVAILGVVVPLGLGYLAAWLVIPEESAQASWEVYLFIGATLCATSVGITARVLKDLGRSQQKESRIILGAAVIDDVLGLIVLAVVSGVIAQGEISVAGLIEIVGWAFGFLAGALVLGALNFPKTLFNMASHLRGHGLLVVTALVICFGFSYLANLVGLAPIIGAFAAGLILERAHYREAGKDKRWHDRELEDALAPLSALLVPIFFVEMGIQVDLTSFADPSVWGLAAAITVMAIIGKQVCALGVIDKGLNKTAVGLGMIPRGEVGLIFANVGRNLTAKDENGKNFNVIDTGTYSAIVVMVMITTMVTPPLLKWSLSKDSDDGETDAPPREDHH